MSSRLKTRIKRLEKKRRDRQRSNRVPARAEFDDVAFRNRVRNVYSAKLKLYRIGDWGEDGLWDSLSDHDRKILEDDTSELRARDEDVRRRSKGVHWHESSHAARAMTRLRSLERVGGQISP